MGGTLSFFLLRVCTDVSFTDILFFFWTWIRMMGFGGLTFFFFFRAWAKTESFDFILIDYVPARLAPAVILLFMQTSPILLFIHSPGLRSCRDTPQVYGRLAYVTGLPHSTYILRSPFVKVSGGLLFLWTPANTTSALQSYSLFKSASFSMISYLKGPRKKDFLHCRHGRQIH